VEARRVRTKTDRGDEMTDFGSFKITEVIMHQIPGGRDDAGQGIDYSEAPIELRAVDRGFIEGQLRKTLGGYARPVVEDEDEESPTPEIVRELLSDAGDLVRDSSTLADEIVNRQKWVSPSGLLMVIRGTVDAGDCLVIAKMEHQEGMRVQRAETADGKKTFRAEYLRELILGENTKVFKAGAFAAADAARGTALTGQVVDDQQGGGHVAGYFVGFLGCKFTEKPDVLTEKLFKETQRFIRRVTKNDPELAAEYEIALLAEMQNQGRRVSAQRFANTHLQPEHRDDYIARVREAGVPAREFSKDITLIAASIRRLKVQTGRGATVFVPPEMYEDGSVTVEQLDGEDSQITVTDRITGMTGASGPKRDSEQ
jgi:hypothetical protein